jgi:hypothetical protein
MLRRPLFGFIFAVGIIFLSASIYPDEGMWPISEISKLDLQSKGLEIAPDEVFSMDKLSLVQAVVQVGATGSFVSNDGLIITNHHVAYGAVQAASTKEKDYIQHGFLARDRSDEIRAEGLTARITESYKDVSDEVLRVIKKKMGYAERTKAVEKKIKKIVVREEKKNPGKRVEVAEMFTGKTYVLFIFTYLKDIRLVYVPPRSIGNFGGEVDNWMWPRHTGDFSFLRAYVAPNGSPADYSEKNVPYHPKKYLQVNPKGVDEGDFVFLLGYPGRTYRHRTSHFLSYEEEIRMPWVADWYAWQISVMEKMGEDDRAVALKHLSRIRGLSNTMKNYRGKLLGLNRLQLVEKKRIEEQKLQRFIESAEDRKTDYGDLLDRIEKIYEEVRARSEYDLILDYLRRSVNMIQFAYTAYEASIERQKKDIERESAYMDRNFARTKQRLERSHKNYYKPTDKIILKEILKRASQLPEDFRISALEDVFEGDDLEKSIENFIDQLYHRSHLDDVDVLMGALDKSTQELKDMEDPFLQLCEALYPVYQDQKETDQAQRGILAELSAHLIDVKKEFYQKEFIPDANRTLRLTFGRIRGYSPRDAVYYKPITTLEGIVQKTTGEEPFDTPQKIMDLNKAKDFGQFLHPESNSVPACLLYDADTTGGNSGSPVLNARGELVGVNFDRAWEATVNDYQWSEDYSRSIAVDIRYVLWITQKFGGVEYLLREMNVLAEE